MSFLRLGATAAIIDDHGQILLSRRGDLDVWNLPTGRLDSGEVLAHGAAREAREETGVVVNIERPVGLYYFQATSRMNVLFEGFPVGGRLQALTEETRDNRYFPVDKLPENLFAAYMARDALLDKSKTLMAIDTPRNEIRRIQRKLAWRWVKNLLRGRMEPRHVRFDIRAVGVVWDEAHKRVIVLPGEREHVLPYVQCSGDAAPWNELSNGFRRWFNLDLTFHWAGIWQDSTKNVIEFVFASTANVSASSSQVNWMNAQNSALIGRDAQYVAHVLPTYPNDKVWTILEDEIENPSTILVDSSE